MKLDNPYFLAASAAAISFTAWSGNVAGFLALPALILCWRFAKSRTSAFIILLIYYLVAGRGLFHGAGVFFSGAEGIPHWLIGLTVWVVPSTLLALCWTALWGVGRRGARLIAALVLVSLPPVGVFGWANPLTSAGALFPGWGCAGLLLTGILLVQLSRQGYRHTGTLPFVGLAILANLSFVPPISSDWIGINTSVGAGRDSFEEYERLDALRSAVRKASRAAPEGAVLVLPELVGGDWSINKMWWQKEAELLRRREQTALVGAYLPLDSGRSYVNGLFGVGAGDNTTFVDRVPVPISMWRPFSGSGAVTFWFSDGIQTLHGRRVASLICYEQLLIWPVLLSAAHAPDVYVGAANDWWAKGTSIPSIQRSVTTVWARLFGKPYVWAKNE